MKLFLLAPAVAIALVGCGTSTFQPYEGRSDKIVEGEGGTKEIIGGYEFWDNGTPPRRYKVLGVSTVEDQDNPVGRQLIRMAMADQIKQAGGDAAVVVDGFAQGRRSAVMVGSTGQVAVGGSVGRRQVRFQIIKYLDQPSPTAGR